MKLRCKNCNKIIKLPISNTNSNSFTCPECGTMVTLAVPQNQYDGMKLENTTFKANSSGSSKGTLPTKEKSTEIVGWIITFIVFSVLGSITSLLWEESVLLGIISLVLFIIITISVGIWFHNKSMRGKK